MRKIGKKATLGLGTAKDFVVAILILSVVAFATIIALGTLQDVDVLTDAGYADNQTTNVLQNVSEGTADFFDNAGSWFSLLAVVIIILIIAVVILAVNRFGGRAQGAL